MIPNIAQNLQTMISSTISDYLINLPESYPCKVKSYADGLVEVETLLVSTQNDIPTKIPALQSPYFTLPIQEGDIGLALNCSFLFYPILEGKTLENNIKTTQKNGLFFIPLLPKDQQNEVGDITFKTAPEFKSKMIFNDESLSFVVAENTNITIDGSTMSFDINSKGTLNLSESEFSLGVNGNTSISVSDSAISFSVGGNEIVSMDSSTLSTPLGIEQSTPIALKGSGGSLKDYNDLIIQLLDALASGMAGSGTNPSAYQTLKASLLTQLQGMFK